MSHLGLYLKHSMVLKLEAILLQFYKEYLILDYERDQKILYKLITAWAYYSTSLVYYCTNWLNKAFIVGFNCRHVVQD